MQTRDRPWASSLFGNQDPFTMLKSPAEFSTAATSVWKAIWVGTGGSPGPEGTNTSGIIYPPETIVSLDTVLTLQLLAFGGVTGSTTFDLTWRWTGFCTTVGNNLPGATPNHACSVVIPMSIGVAGAQQSINTAFTGTPWRATIASSWEGGVAPACSFVGATGMTTCTQVVHVTPLAAFIVNSVTVTVSNIVHASPPSPMISASATSYNKRYGCDCAADWTCSASYIVGVGPTPIYNGPGVPPWVNNPSVHEYRQQCSPYLTLRDMPTTYFTPIGGRRLFSALIDAAFVDSFVGVPNFPVSSY